MPSSSRRVATSLALAGCTIVLAGCSGDQFGRTFGFIRDAPDEFTVTTRAPLAMPPTYSLPPPRPGATRPQEQSERTQAELALVPQMALGTPPAGSSPGQQALVQAAGPPAPAGIRTEVDAGGPARSAVAKLCRPADVLADAAAARGRGRSGEGGEAPARERGTRAEPGDRGHTDRPAEAAGVPGRDLLAIAADRDAPHFVQVGAAPVFRGAGIGDLSCGCGSVLIEGYLPANFLAIRIQCFRCGAVTGTPGLPDGEILSRAAVPVAAAQAPAVSHDGHAARQRAGLPGCGHARLRADPAAAIAGRTAAAVARRAGGGCRRL